MIEILTLNSVMETKKDPFLASGAQEYWGSEKPGVLRLFSVN